MNRRIPILLSASLFILPLVSFIHTDQSYGEPTDRYSKRHTDVTKTWSSEFTDEHAKNTYLKEVEVNEKTFKITVDIEALKKKSGDEIFLNENFVDGVLQLPMSVDLSQLRPSGPEGITEPEKLREYGFVYAHQRDDYGRTKAYGVLYIVSIKDNALKLAYLRGTYREETDTFTWVAPMIGMRYNISGHYKKGVSE